MQGLRWEKNLDGNWRRRHWGKQLDPDYYPQEENAVAGAQGPICGLVEMEVEEDWMIWCHVA